MSYQTSYANKFATYLEKNKEIGFVEKIMHPVIYVSGLPTAHLNEFVVFETGHIGFITALLESFAEIVVLSNDIMKVGTRVARTDDLLKIGVGDALLGNVVNALGDSLYSDVTLKMSEKRFIDNVPPNISARERITRPFTTGVSYVDLLIPLGKGQRELVIGDRNIGKTSFVLQALLQQASEGVICIYTCIGKKQHSVRKVEQFVKEHDLSANVVIVASSASDPLGMTFLTPYTAMTIAEYFKDQGKDTLIIFDDLTNHAKYYRELSLLAKNFPGRDSYPSDIFYIHSRLLERAGNFSYQGKTKVSITCLPVIETVEGDISGYIQTNLMSITDGHIFFDGDLFKNNKRPPINYFLSVTRVGRQTQDSLRWSVNRELSAFIVLYNKTERFIHFGSELNEGIKATLQMGDKLNILFNQNPAVVYPIELQLFLFSAIWASLPGFDTVALLRDSITQYAQLYVNDSLFRELVINLMKDNKDLNQLLGALRSKTSAILSHLDRKKYEKN